MPKKTHNDYAKQFSLLNYSFAMNDLNDRIEVNGQTLNDGMAAEIESRMNDNDFPVSNCRRAWTYEAHKNRYNPLHDLFDNLSWAGQDIFGQFINCFKFVNPSFAKIALWRFMLGTIGKVLNQDQNFVLVLDGGQGIGKSWLCRWLCPDEKYFTEGSLHPDSNDTKLLLISRLIWEIGELQYTTRKADVEAIKNIISQKEITTRPPYHRYEIIKPSVCSFIGTINENGAGFLNDPTGSRRFVVVKIKSIDWRAYKAIDKFQLWSQVYDSYKAGERGYLSPGEQKEQFKINESYGLVSSTYEILMKFIEIDEIKYVNVWIPASDILLHLFENGMTGSQRVAQMEIAAFLEKEGVKKSNLNSQTGHGRKTCYYGIKLIN